MFKRILKISRPRFWFYIAGPYLVGLSLLYRQYVFSPEWKYLLTFLFFLFPMNFLLYSVNDYFDQDTDAKNPKKSAIENRFATKDKKITFIIQLVSLIFAVLILILLSTLREKLVFILFLCLSLFYSIPPISFKRRPFLDALSNVLYFLPGVIAVYHSPLLSIDVLTFIALACWTTAMHLFSAIPDIEYDKKAGIKTTAVVLGEKKSLLWCFLLWSTFAVISFSYNPILFPVFIYPFIPIILLVNKDLSIGKIYWYFPYINGILGFLFFLFNVFSV